MFRQVLHVYVRELQKKRNAFFSIVVNMVAVEYIWRKKNLFVRSSLLLKQLERERERTQITFFDEIVAGYFYIYLAF